MFDVLGPLDPHPFDFFKVLQEVISGDQLLVGLSHPLELPSRYSYFLLKMSYFIFAALNFSLSLVDFLFAFLDFFLVFLEQFSHFGFLLLMLFDFVGEATVVLGYFQALLLNLLPFFFELVEVFFQFVEYLLVLGFGILIFGDAFLGVADDGFVLLNFLLYFGVLAPFLLVGFSLQVDFLGF